jgi:hypothetical protein
MRRRRTSPEAGIQRAVIQHLRIRGAVGLFAFHPANGGYRTPVEAAIFKGLGVVPGVPDVVIVHRGRVYGLELKADGGKLTTIQTEVHEKLMAAGAEVATACGIDEALHQLDQWGLLRGVAS